MDDNLFTSAEREDLQYLQSMFEDIDIATIKLIYLQNDKDVKATMQALGELAKNPKAAIQSSSASYQSFAPVQNEADSRLQPSASGSGRSLSELQRSGSAGGLATLGLASSPPEDDSSVAWDVNGLADALTTVGNSVTEGITSLATNITGWVADLAAAFDASWGDDDEQARSAHMDKQKDLEAKAVYGGLDNDRIYHRRQGQSSGTRGYASGSAEEKHEGSEGDEEEEEDEDEDDWKKDA